MAELFAVLVVTIIGYYAILDLEPNAWFKDMVQGYWHTIESFNIKSDVVTWFIVVAVPAIIVGIFDFLLSHIVLSFIFDLVILLLTTAIGTFIIKHKALIKAVYANDVDTAAIIANDWQDKNDEVVDAKNIFVKRMLDLTIQRLHYDILLILLWYTILGAGGAIFIATHLVYSNIHEVKFKEMNQLLKWCTCPSILAMSVAGNMVPTLSVMPRFELNAAAMHATDNVEGPMDIEKVPLFGNFLMRTFFVGVGAALVFIMVVYI